MEPLLGRTPVASEESFGGSRVAVISEQFWTRRFGRDPQAIGRRLIVAGGGVTIIGVMPRNFSSSAVEIWLPAQLPPVLTTMRDARFVTAVGRMKPNVSPADARADLVEIQRRLGEQYPATDRNWTASVTDLLAASVKDYQRTLWLLFGVAFVLLLAITANVGGLMLIHLHRRQSELALRQALGGSTWQAINPFLWEVGLFTVGGASIGLLGAWPLLALLKAELTSLPRLAEITINWRTWTFALAASAGSACLFGLMPAMLAMRRLGLPQVLRGSGISRSQHRFHALLVTGQVATGFALTVTAGLLLRSYGNLQRVDMGFTAEGVITFRVGAGWAENRASVGQFQQHVVRELARQPGVVEVGVSSFLPLSGGTVPSRVTVEGIVPPTPDNTSGWLVGTRMISVGYLRALRVPLHSGTWCPDWNTGETTTRSVMVNQRFETLAGRALVGRRLSFDLKAPPSTIVGVIGDIAEEGPGLPSAPYMYVCDSPGSWPDPRYVLRASGPTVDLATTIRSAVRSGDRNRAVFAVTPLADVVDAALGQPRLNAGALAACSLVALLLTTLGLYGLLTLQVMERTREIGLRAALGATQLHLLALVIRQSMRMVLTGLAVGLGASFVAGTWLHASLFKTAAIEGRVLAVATCVVLWVTIIATAWPAWRSSRVEPLAALRVD